MPGQTITDRPFGGRNERGSATVLTVAAAAVILVLAFATAVLVGFLVTSHHARQTADLAAVSGAATAARGGAGCPVAERITRANRARLISCEQVGDEIEQVITVVVRVPVRTPLRGLPRRSARPRGRRPDPVTAPGTHGTVDVT
jgi:secretion/DNA translocation related TadE-like protein